MVNLVVDATYQDGSEGTPDSCRRIKVFAEIRESQEKKIMVGRAK
jgi:hypothetical protein